MLGRRRRKRAAEQSEGGQPIYRHKPVDREFLAATADPAVREHLEGHLEGHLGPMSFVLHEIISDRVHLDVYVWRPTEERPMYTFVTGGMSDLPMTVPPEASAAGASDRAELMVCLPPSWPVPIDGPEGAAWQDDETYFPVRSLKQLARLPHDYGTWLGFGHTIPNGDPPEPFTPTTGLSGWVVLSPTNMPAGFRQVDIESIGGIEVFGLVALHEDEMNHKLAHGSESLFDGFDRHQVSELLDLERGSSLR